jgi:hypothetical protein
MEAQSKMPATQQTSAPTLLAGGGRFIGNFVVMCAAMCLGGGLLAAATFLSLSWLGYSPSTSQAILILAVEITVPMSLLMVVLHHPTSHNLEMSAASFGAGLLVLVGYWLGLVPGDALTQGIFGLMCGVMCLAMLADMIVRARHYTGQVAHRH